MTAPASPDNESLPASAPPDQEAYGAIARWRTTFVPTAGWDEEHRPRPVAASVVTADVRRRRQLAPIAILMAAGLVGIALVVGLLPSSIGEGVVPPVATSGGAAQAPVAPPEGSDNGQGSIANPPAPGSVVLAPASQPAAPGTLNGILASSESSSTLVSELAHPAQTVAPSAPQPAPIAAQPATVALHRAAPPAVFPVAVPVQPIFPALPPVSVVVPPVPVPPFPLVGPPALPPFPVLPPVAPPAPFPVPGPH